MWIIALLNTIKFLQLYYEAERRFNAELSSFIEFITLSISFREMVICKYLTGKSREIGD